MNAIRLNPNEQQQPFSLMTKRTGTGEDEVTVEISGHSDRRAALDALYDHIHRLMCKGFACECVNLLRWKAERWDPDKLIQCAVWIAEK